MCRIRRIPRKTIKRFLPRPSFQVRYRLAPGVVFIALVKFKGSTFSLSVAAPATEADPSKQPGSTSIWNYERRWLRRALQARNTPVQILIWSIS